MGNIKKILKERYPGLFNTLRSGRDAMVRTADLPSMVFHPWYLNAKKEVFKYQNRYQGKRCFVIGNGPSLKDTDLSLIKDEYTFGMNRVYLAFDDWGFQTSFLVSVNDLVIEQCHEDFHDLSLPKFFSWRSKELLFPEGEPDIYTHFLHTTYTGPKFNRQITNRFWEGATVTYICLQLAYCMGFDEVYLIGVDHSFDTKGKATQTIISSGDDPNHFSPEYFGKGFRWQLPDLDTSEVSYKLAYKNYLDSGRRVFDATVGGKLDVFPKVNYEGLFS
jgi:hypothetical protein